MISGLEQGIWCYGMYMKTVLILLTLGLQVDQRRLPKESESKSSLEEGVGVFQVNKEESSRKGEHHIQGHEGIKIIE